MYTKFWLKNLKERDHLKDLGIDRTIILEWILKEIGWEGWAAFIWLRIGTKWQALVNMVMNFWVPQKMGSFLTM
jgi:hypothetical protein